MVALRCVAFDSESDKEFRGKPKKKSLVDITVPWVVDRPVASWSAKWTQADRLWLEVRDRRATARATDLEAKAAKAARARELDTFEVQTRRHAREEAARIAAEQEAKRQQRRR